MQLVARKHTCDTDMCVNERETFAPNNFPRKESSELSGHAVKLQCIID